VNRYEQRQIVKSVKEMNYLGRVNGLQMKNGGVEEQLK
jgi:hypothetical protein